MNKAFILFIRMIESFKVFTKGCFVVPIRMNHLKIYKYIVSIFLLSMVSFTSGCGNSTSASELEEGNGQARETVYNVQVKEIVAEDMIVDISLPGHTEPWEQVTITSEVPGVVKHLYIREGMTVSPGRLIMEINPDEYRANMDIARVNRDASLQRYNRRLSLLQNHYISREEYESIETAYKTSQSQFELARMNYHKSQIRVPDRGGYWIVEQINVDQGEFVAAGVTKLLEAVNINKIKVILSLPERLVNHIKVGDEVEVGFDTLGDVVLTGKVIYVSVLSQGMSKTYECKIEVVNPEHIIKPGMLCKVNIITDVIKDSIKIPAVAINMVDRTVFVMEDGRAIKRRLVLGGYVGDDFQVLEGLNPGDMLIVDGFQRLRDGDRVQISEGVERLQQRERPEYDVYQRLGLHPPEQDIEEQTTDLDNVSADIPELPLDVEEMNIQIEGQQEE